MKKTLYKTNYRHSINF